MTANSRQKFKYLDNERSFKKHFSSFSKGFQLPKILILESAPSNIRLSRKLVAQSQGNHFL